MREGEIMLDAIRRYWRRRKARLTLFYHRSDFEGVEIMVALAMLWRAYSLATLGGYVTLFPDARHVTGPGSAMVAETAAFWAARLGGAGGLGWASLACLAASLLALYGVVEEHTRLRHGVMVACLGWWLASWWLLFVNTPHHVGGGLYLIVAGGAWWVSARLNCRRAKEEAFLRRAYAVAMEEDLLPPGAVPASL